MGDYLTGFPENSKYIVSLDHFKQKQKGTNLYLKIDFPQSGGAY